MCVSTWIEFYDVATSCNGLLSLLIISFLDGSSTDDDEDEEEEEEEEEADVEVEGDELIDNASSLAVGASLFCSFFCSAIK